MINFWQTETVKEPIEDEEDAEKREKSEEDRPKKRFVTKMSWW